MSSRILRSMSSSSAQSRRQPQPSKPSALELVDVLVEIFSYIGTPHELLQYRLVCQKWNEAAVHTLVTKRKNCFPLRLRYGPQIMLSLFQCDAERLAKEILKCPSMILTGTSTPLSFDTVVIDRDFYLAGINREWQDFLGIYGESIRHLKFNIRSGRKPEKNCHYVVDCDQVVSKENLKTAFSAMPNLESLDFLIRFSHYKMVETLDGELQRMFPEASEVSDLPQLAKLTKITIEDPHGVQYDHGLLREILGMAPNLTTLYIKFSISLSNFASVLRGVPNLVNTLTTLGITMKDCSPYYLSVFNIEESGFSRFNLTKLELNCVSGDEEHLEEFLQSQRSTLITLILGNRVTPMLEPGTYNCRVLGPYLRFGETENHCCRRPLYGSLSLPHRMGSLKVLEVKLSKFKLEESITKYPNQFPALEELTLSNCEETGCVWTYRQLHHILPGVLGYSHTVKKFFLLGQMPGGSERMNIIEAARSTFPIAQLHFGL